MDRKVFSYVRALADLFMPRECVVCGERLFMNEKYLCISCLADLPLTFLWRERHNPMADRFNAKIQQWLEMEGSAAGPVPYSYAAALFYYKTGNCYGRITQRLKYHGDIPEGKYFARKLGMFLSRAGHLQDVDAVVPVPLHWTRLRARGYNQAEVIAREVASAMGVRLRKDILSRTRRTRTQTKLSVAMKAENVRDAFRASFHGRIPAHILLVDDVFTTGSTLFACWLAIRKALESEGPGAPECRISVATLAFVGGY